MFLLDSILKNKFTLILALCLPAFLLYFKSIHYDFTMLDEQWLIVQNADLSHGSKALTNGFTKSITGLYYRPMLILSVYFDYQFSKLSPGGYHLSNLIMHLVCILLLFKFLCLNRVSKKTSFVCCLIFSVHPMLLHAVAWVPGRNDLLLCIFSLLSIIFLLLFFDKRKTLFLILHFSFLIFAYLTKETAIALPLIFVANYFVYKKFEWKQFSFLIASWLLISLAWLYLRDRIVEVPAPDSTSLFETLKIFTAAMIFYTGKAIFSLQQSILPLLRHASLIPGFIAILLLSLLAFKPGLKDKKIAALGLFLFFVILALPVWFSASKNSAEHYEHRIYTAMAGLILFFTQLKFNYKSRLFQFVLASTFMFYFIKTLRRLPIYKNNESFVNAGIKECPDNYLFIAAKSSVLFNQNNFTEALEFDNKAITLRPDKAQLYSNRGSANFKLGLYENAASDFSEAIKRSQRVDYTQYLSRALAYEKCNKIGKAMKDLIFLKKSGQALVPADIDNLISGRWSETLKVLTEQIASQKNKAKLLYQRALLYSDAGMEKEALEDLSAANNLDPGKQQY
jgi:protein O-mannosyl-transferase